MSMIVLMAVAQTGAVTPASEMPTKVIEQAQKDDNALSLVDRLMPTGIRGRIITGQMRRQFLPYMSYWIAYHEAPRAEGDLCVREGHSVRAADPLAPQNTQPHPSMLKIGPIDSWTEVAVMPPGRVASAATCGVVQGFISVRADRERQIAAYRVLVAAMAVARSKATLPFEVECASEKTDACVDPRQALANLPMEVSFGISVRCLDTDRIIDGSTPGVRMISCPPISKGAPYQAEIAFSNSGVDGQSWRVTFTHRAGWPDRMKIRRSMVIYH